MNPQEIDLASLVLPSGRIAALVLLNSADARIPALASLVRSDPGLAMILLRAANSAESSSRRRIADPAEAVVRVGLNQTKRLIGAAIVGSALSALDGCGIDLNAFWAYSLAAAIATEDEVEVAHLRSAAFSVGLLHDLGRLALAASAPASYTRMASQPRTEPVILAAEQLLFGEDHASASARLLSSVGLPPDLVEMVADHHRSVGEDTANPLVRARRLVVAAGFSDGLPLHIDSAVTGIDLRRASSLLDQVEWYRSTLHSSDRFGRFQPAPLPDFARSDDDDGDDDLPSVRKYSRVGSANRRSVFRASTVAQASVYTIVGDRLGSAYSGTIRNVSLEGAGLTLPTARLFPGDRVAIGFMLEGEQYWLRSEVRWIRSLRVERCHELGVAFEPLTSSDQRRLWSQIAEAERTSRPIGPVEVPLGVEAWRPRKMPAWR